MNIDTLERSQTFTWDDPIPGAIAAQRMSGLDYLKALMRGEFSTAPLSRALNFTLIEVEMGRAVFQSQPAEYHYNPIGSVHGGYAATLLDSALGCAVHSTLQAGVGYTTVQLQVNMVRAMNIDTGMLLCEGNVIHTGRRMMTAEGRLMDKSGRVYAHGTSTCLILSE